MNEERFGGGSLDELPFFTALDPDARIKGSRDPLGFEQLWTGLGRTVVGNLTTVTRSVRQFSTLLFGFYFADKATEERAEREEFFLPVFLRFEQLAAYARYRDPAARSDIRGIRAVSRNVQENSSRLWLSAKNDWQILSDQKTYGIYGLFRMAAQSSGLLELQDETRLTPVARQHVESQLQAARITPTIVKQIVDCISRNTTIALEDSIVKVVAKLLVRELSAGESDFYGTYLVRGAHLTVPLDVQRQLWDCMEAVNSKNSLRWENEFSMGELRRCIAEARRRGDEELAGRLDRVRRAEELLGAAAMLYDFLLRQNNQSLGTVVRQIATGVGGPLTWLNVADLKPAFGSAAERLERLAASLLQGDFAEACRGLIGLNEAVMSERGGSAWIVLKDDKLDVRFLEAGGDLPEPEEIRQPWAHTYFLNALKRVGGCVYHDHFGGDEDGAD